MKDKFQQKAMCEDVARAFLLANKLKRSPIEPTDFHSKLTKEREQLARLDYNALLATVEAEWKPRRILYERGDWIFRVVNLDQCSVWEKMGEEQWARGPVGKVAELFPKHAKPDNRIWSMLSRIKLTFAELPLIVIRSTNDPESRFRIDDGNHRAVAYYLAGFRQAFSFIGRVPDSINYSWKWEG